MSSAAVEYVLALSDADHSDSIEPAEFINAVAIWCTLRQQQDEIDSSFDEFDVDHSGKLSREQVREMLQHLNDDLPVTWTEVDWLIESSDVDGDGSLDRSELRAAVACWYVHVGTRVIKPTSGWRAMLPWVLCGCTALTCSLLVASVSVMWSAGDTKTWLGTTVLGLFWKMVIFDPLKTLFCGSLLEPLMALVTGELSADAFLESMEDVIETYTEEFTGATVGGEVVDDISLAAQRSTVAAGNNAVLAMGSVGAGKFQRKVAMSRAKRGIKLDMASLKTDTDLIGQRLELQKTVSHNRYADKVAAKREAAGLVGGGGFQTRSLGLLLSSRELQMAHSDHEHTQVAANFVASAALESQSVDDMLAAQAVKQRRRYAGQVATKRRARMMSIGAFARSADVHVDPLIDVLAVAKFIGLKNKGAQFVDEKENLEMVDEIRAAEEEESALQQDLQNLASGKIELPASILAATSPSRKWHPKHAQHSAAGQNRWSHASTSQSASSAKSVAGMFSSGVNLTAAQSLVGNGAGMPNLTECELDEMEMWAEVEDELGKDQP